MPSLCCVELLAGTARDFKEGRKLAGMKIIVDKITYLMMFINNWKQKLNIHMFLLDKHLKSVDPCCRYIQSHIVIIQMPC